MVLGSLRRPDVETYEPGVRSLGSGDGGGAWRVTLDARDPERWIRFDLDEGSVVGTDGPWDLAFRRHEVRARLEAVERELESWYRYDFLSHLLTPRDRTFRVPAGDRGRTAELRFLSYYCPGPTAGCVTFRYELSG